MLKDYCIQPNPTQLQITTSLRIIKSQIPVPIFPDYTSHTSQITKPHSATLGKRLLQALRPFFSSLSMSHFCHCPRGVSALSLFIHSFIRSTLPNPSPIPYPPVPRPSQVLQTTWEVKFACSSKWQQTNNVSKLPCLALLCTCLA